MRLWDSNILRHYGEGNENLARYLRQTDWSKIALPSIVVAEVLRGRAEHALKATPVNAPQIQENGLRKS